MQKESIEMKFKKTIVSLTGLALLSVDSLTLSSNPVSAAENDDSTTVTLKVKKAKELFGNSMNAYYFDIPFEETVKRHQERHITSFGEEKMRSWWL
mgnify:CR=1 FL=1